jgi:ribosomal protein S27AE
MFDKCPGASNIRTPTIELKACPRCGAEIEMCSSDMQIDCPKCGFTIYNDLQSCIQWCKYAKECVGEEVYERLMKQASKEEQSGD